MPGIRYDTRPLATVALVVASVAVSLALEARLLPAGDVVLQVPLEEAWWRPFTALFVYGSQGYLLCALAALGLFGWLLERRHGAWAPPLVFLAGGGAGMLAVLASETAPEALGGNGAALAMVGAWALPDLRERRAGGDTDSDLLGAAVIAAVLLLLPLAVPGQADPVAGVVGGLVGLAIGLALSAFSRER